MKKLHLSAYLILVFLLLFFSSAIAQEKTWTAKEAVDFALANSPDSTIARKRIEAVQAMVEQSLSGNFPQVYLSGEYSQTNNPMYSFGNILNQGEFDQSIDFNDPGRTDNLQLKAEMRYRLYSGGSITANIKAAVAHKDSSELNLAAVQNQLAFEVVKIFHLINQAKDMVNASQAALKAMTVSLEVARARFDAGDLLKQDLLNIELQVARAQENLIQANHDLALTKRGFLNLLGLTDATITIQSPVTNEQSVPDTFNFDNRPETKQIEAVIRAAQAELKKAQGAKLPVIDTFANYQVNTGTVLDGTGDSWMAGIRLNYILFDGHRTSGAIHIAQAKLLEAQARKKKVVLDMHLELEKARLGFHQAEEKLRVTGKMVDLASESARLSRIRFKEGVVLASELIDVETRMTDALVRQSGASAMRKIAVADLRRAVGLPQF